MRRQKRRVWLLFCHAQAQDLHRAVQLVEDALLRSSGEERPRQNQRGGHSALAVTFVLERRCTMLRVVCGAVILTGLMVQSAEACRHRRGGGCGESAPCCQSAPCCESAPASTPAPPAAPEAQARSQTQRQFSYEPAMTSAVPPSGVYDFDTPMGARPITKSGGVRRASEKAFGNY